MSLGHPVVLLDIIEEHFDELDFLWEQRESIIFAPDHNLAELAEHEERAEAHLDGLRLAELHAVELARPALTGSETFAATAATFVLMETGEEELVKEVLAAFAEAKDPAPRAGIRIGLRHSKIDAIGDRLRVLAAAEDPALAAAAADVVAFHRLPVPDPRRLLGAEDPVIRALVYGALGRSRGLTAYDEMVAALRDPDPEVQRAALHAAALSRLPGLEDLCRSAATDRDAPSRPALAFLGVLGNPADLPLLRAAAREPESGPTGLAGLGAMGHSEVIPVLIELMGDETLAEAAANAFKRITGADDIHMEPPPPPPAAEEEGEGEEEDELGAEALEAEAEVDEGLAPDPAKAQAWWTANAERFSAEGCWQTGVGVSAAFGTPLFDQLSLQARRDLYLRLRSTDPAIPDIELEARAVAQGA